MITYQRKAGTTDVSVVIRIVDSGDGTPETGVTSATSGINLGYRREGAAVVNLTETDLSALTDAHSDGGLLHISGGYYRVDLPDAACASGATGVLVAGTITGMVVIGCYVQLVAYDPFDTIRLGLTALPNAAADAAGGLPISDAGGLDLDTQIGTKINDILTDTGTTLQGELDGIQADTEDIQTKIGTPSNLGGGANLAANLSVIVSNLTDVQDYLETLILDTAPIIAYGTVASAGTNNIDLGSLLMADNDVNDCLIRFKDVSGFRYYSTWILDFTGSTSVVTLDSALPFTTENGVDTFTIYAIRRNDLKVLSLDTSIYQAVATAMYTNFALNYDDDAEVGSVIRNTVAKILKYLQLLFRSDAAIATDNATELTELNASGGSGVGDASNQTDSLEALRDNTGTAGAGLTAIDLPDQTMNITGNITGNLSGSVGSVTGAVGSVTGNVGGNVTGSVGSLATQAKADVNAEVVDVLRTDTIPDSYAADGAQPTIAQAILAIQQYLQERSVSGTTVTVKKPDGSTTAMTFTLNDATSPTSQTRVS